jgi:hypothetical protein
VHGLFSILPKQTGLTHDSLLTGGTLLVSPKLCSMGVMEPVKRKWNSSTSMTKFLFQEP